MVTKIITRTRRISSVKRSSAAENSNRGDDEGNNKRNNTQVDNSNDDDKYHCNEGKENHLAKKLKGCQNKAADGGMICDNGHSYHDVFFRCKPNDNTTADDGKAVAFRQHTADTTFKKRPLLLDDDEVAKCQKGEQMCIDLTDVPLKLPTKNNKKGASSKYQGVYFDYSTNKWMAKSMIDGKPDHIGQKFVDLSDVPPQLPIIGNKKGASSKYQGVCFDNRRNKWKARIMIHGKQHHIGNYENEEEAAVDYARVVFKYEEGKVNARRKYGTGTKQMSIDLTGVPPQLPILKSHGKVGSSKYQGVCFDKRRNKWKATIALDGKQYSIAEHVNNHDRYETSKYQGVYFKTAEKKWQAAISLDGKLYGVGTYDTEEEAAVDFARAKFKYVQNSSTMVKSHTDKESNGEM